MVISVLNIKGGVGKTTVSVNLACALEKQGQRVLLVDSDVQGSALSWRAQREEPGGPAVISLANAQSLRKQIRHFAMDYDCIIIDGSPNVDLLAAVSIAMSDLVLLPVGPSPLDIWATEKMVMQISEAQQVNEQIQAAFIVNRFNALTLLSRETKEVLQDYELPVLQTTLGSRVAYADTMTQGLSVLEWRDRKAKQEIDAMVAEINEMIFADNGVKTA